MTAAAGVWNALIGSEPPEARRRWFELDRIAAASGVPLDDLLHRLRDDEGLYGRARGLVEELHRLGSLERLYALTDEGSTN